MASTNNTVTINASDKISCDHEPYFSIGLNVSSWITAACEIYRTKEFYQTK